jgi:hypothetical protein
MPNLRIVANNLANNATPSASSVAGGLVAANLLTDYKSQTCRSTGTTQTLTLSWTTFQQLSCLILAATNLSSIATVRVQGYSDAGVTQVLDTGAVQASQYTPGSTAAVSNFAYGGAVNAFVWFALTGVNQLTITITDTGNAAGFIDIGRIIAGAYWSPSKNADMGTSLGVVDNSVHGYNAAGDLITTIGTRRKKINFNMSNMYPADRTTLMNLFLSNGMAQPVYFSLFPQSADPIQEQHYQMYCKLSTLSQMSYAQTDRYTVPLELIEV